MKSWQFVSNKYRLWTIFFLSFESSLVFSSVGFLLHVELKTKHFSKQHSHKQPKKPGIFHETPKTQTRSEKQAMAPGLARVIHQSVCASLVGTKTCSQTGLCGTADISGTDIYGKTFINHQILPPRGRLEPFSHFNLFLKMQYCSFFLSGQQISREWRSPLKYLDRGCIFIFRS